MTTLQTYLQIRMNPLDPRDGLVPGESATVPRLERDELSANARRRKFALRWRNVSAGGAERPSNARSRFARRLVYTPSRTASRRASSAPLVSPPSI
jgi:hypothetical protein